MSKNRGSKGFLRRQFSRRPLPVWIVVLADILVFGIALNAYALFHHVLPRRQESLHIVSQRYQVMETMPPMDPEEEVEVLPTPTVTPPPRAAESPTPEPTEEITEADMEEKDWVGHFGRKFADRFTDGELIKSKDGYRGDTLSVTLKKQKYKRSIVHVADIYVKDITQLRTAFANDTFGVGQFEWPRHTSKRVDSVISVNGDNYAARQDGLVIRNGELFKARNISMEVCVIFWDGRMETYKGRKFNGKAAIAAGAYQAWNFGPSLLDGNGKPLKHFTNTSVDDPNPRTVIGYFEPGHYCLVVVDGRSEDSKGLDFKDLAAMMSALGCKQAFNLDGGNTAMMMVGDQVISDPSDGGRECSDIIYFTP